MRMACAPPVIPGLQRNPASVPSHHLQHHAALGVRFRHGAQPVDGLAAICLTRRVEPGRCSRWRQGRCRWSWGRHDVDVVAGRRLDAAAVPSPPIAITPSSSRVGDHLLMFSDRRRVRSTAEPAGAGWCRPGLDVLRTVVRSSSRMSPYTRPRRRRGIRRTCGRTRSRL